MPMWLFLAIGCAGLVFMLYTLIQFFREPARRRGPVNSLPSRAEAGRVVMMNARKPPLVLSKGRSHAETSIRRGAGSLLLLVTINHSIAQRTFGQTVELPVNVRQVRQVVDSEFDDSNAASANEQNQAAEPAATRPD